MSCLRPHTPTGMLLTTYKPLPGPPPSYSIRGFRLKRSCTSSIPRITHSHSTAHVQVQKLKTRWRAGRTAHLKNGLTASVVERKKCQGQVGGSTKWWRGELCSRSVLVCFSSLHAGKLLTSFSEGHVFCASLYVSPIHKAVERLIHEHRRCR